MATVISALTLKPLFIQAAGGDTAIPYDGYLARVLLGAIWPRTGIVTTDSFTITPRAAGANFSVDVAGGMAVIGGAADLDRYLLHQSAPINVSLTTFNTNPAATRTHKVWLAVYDKQKAAAGTLYQAAIVVTEDTGAGAPTPSGDSYMHSLQIGTVSITTGQASIGTGNIVNLLRHASSSSSGHYAIPISANIADATATTSLDTPRALRVGTLVHLSGGFVRTSGAAFAVNSTYILGNVAAPYRPDSDRFLVAPASAAGSSHATYRLTVRTTGNLEALTPNDWAPPWLGLDGLTYELD